MHKQALLLSSLSFTLVFIAACGGTAETSDSTSEAIGSDDPGASESATATATDTGASNAASSAASTSEPVESSVCRGRIDVTVDNGAPQRWASPCSGSFDASQANGAFGYAFSGGFFGAPHGIRVVGCATTAVGSRGVTLSALNAAGPGVYVEGSTQYTDPSGGMWGTSGDFFHMSITRADPVGGVIEGSFSVVATQGGSAAHNLAGTFHVCHTPDLLAP